MKRDKKNKLPNEGKVEVVKDLKKIMSKKDKKGQKNKTIVESNKEKEQLIIKDLVEVIRSDEVTNGTQIKKKKQKGSGEGLIKVIHSQEVTNGIQDKKKNKKHKNKGVSLIKSKTESNEKEQDSVKVVSSDDVTNEIQIKKKNKKNQDNRVSLIEKKSQEHKVVAPAKELKESDLAKIEKKKAKKLAQKLKKQQKKALGQDKANDETAKHTLKHKEGKKSKHSEKSTVKNTSTGKLSSEPPSAKNEKKQRKIEKKKKLKELKEDKESRVKIPGEEAATIFVGNLPTNTKRIQLVRLFKDFEPVNAVRFRTGSGKTIYKHKHRLEAGTLNAYIVLKDAETANRALALNGIEFKSNHLRVTRADKNAHNSSDSDVKRTIFVGNLKYSATEEKLREIFSSCGEIEYVRCLRDGEKGCNGVAYVCFKSPETVGLALELKETMLDERPIHVERYSVKKLGAKQSRDSAKQATQKPLTGAKKRLNIKNNQVNAKLSKKDSGNENKKKTGFRGVKVDGIKKKQKNKKPPNHMQQLAKKIAPKTI